MRFAMEIARYLTARALVDFRELEVGGDTFVHEMPPDPDFAITITSYPGGTGDPQFAWDRPNFQVKVRGVPNDVVTPYDRLRAIYRELHALRQTTLPDGTFLFFCFGLQSEPEPLGQDENGRHEFIINFRTEVHASPAGRRVYQ